MHIHLVSTRGVATSRHILSGGNDGEHFVDFVHVVFALEDESQTFQAQACIDSGLVELTQQWVILPSALATE